MDVHERLQNVFRDVFDDDNIVINKDTVSTDIEGWDSLEHINLVCAIEDEFGIKFSMGETVSLKNVGEMEDKIKEKMEKVAV